MENRKKSTGFTLVEIIVVLVILAVIAAFTIPAMLGFVEDARGKAAIAEAREVYVAAQGVAAEMYAAYDGKDLSGDAYTALKTIYAQKIIAIVGSDLGITKEVITKEGHTPEENSLEVGTKFTEYNPNSTRYINDLEKFTAKSTAKVWIDSKVSGTDISHLDFHVKAIWYVDRTGRYRTIIMLDPVYGGLSTTVTKIK